jgi:hypothetical protein
LDGSLHINAVFSNFSCFNYFAVVESFPFSFGTGACEGGHVEGGSSVGKQSLDDSEIIKTRKIAKHRIYVERAIQRLKLFRLLKNEIPSSLQHVVNECVFTAAALCNLQKPLVKK